MYKALIVDDEPQTRSYLSVMIPLLDSKWQVCAEAVNGVAALEQYHLCKPDLVLTDIRMPEMDGLLLCEALSEQEHPPHMAILSGYDEFQYVKKAIRFGVSDYLLKPIVRKELAELLLRVEERLQKKHRQDDQLRMLKQLSGEYKRQLMRNFCRAALDNVYIRIQTIQPLLQKMQLQESQSVWCVVVACMDSTPVDVYEQWLQDRYLFLQRVRQLTEEEIACGYALEANDGSLIVCISGTNEEEVLDSADKLVNSAETLCLNHFDTPFICCRSETKLDALQLHEAHKEADKLFALAVIHGNGRYTSSRAEDDIRVKELENACERVIDAWCHESPGRLAQALPEFCETITHNSRAGIRMLLHRAHARLCPHLQRVERKLLFIEENESNALFDKLFSILIEQEAPIDTSAGEKIVADAIRLIREKLDQPISLGSIADELMVSANHLSRVFHALTNESYIKFVTRERLELASRLLTANPDIKVYDVAAQTGYYNIQHFNYVFKKYYGMTPSQFQRSRMSF